MLEALSRLTLAVGDAGRLLLARERPCEPGAQIAVGGGDAAAEVLAETLIETAGPRAKVCVFGAAGRDPVARGHKSAKVLRDAGLVPVVLDVRPHGAELDAYRRIHHLDSCTAIYFAGGSQVLLAKALRGDADYPVLTAIRAAAARGTVIAGTSAGAAVLGDEMITGGASHDSLVGRGPQKVRRMPGLGFRDDVVIDQHFISRGHLGRLIAFLRRQSRHLGLGIDEGAAVVFGRDDWRVAGKSHAVLVEMPTRPGDDILVSLLAAGDRYRPADRVIRRSPAAIPAELENTEIAVQTDAFGRGSLSDLLGRMVETGASRAVAFSLPAQDKSPQRIDKAWRLTFRPTAATAAYAIESENTAKFAVHRLALGIESVALTVSVMRPW